MLRVIHLDLTDIFANTNIEDDINNLNNRA